MLLLLLVIGVFQDLNKIMKVMCLLLAQCLGYSGGSINVCLGGDDTNKVSGTQA